MRSGVLTFRGMIKGGPMTEPGGSALFRRAALETELGADDVVLSGEVPASPETESKPGTAALDGPPTDRGSDCGVWPSPHAMSLARAELERSRRGALGDVERTLLPLPWKRSLCARALSKLSGGETGGSSSRSSACSCGSVDAYARGLEKDGALSNGALPGLPPTGLMAPDADGIGTLSAPPDDVDIAAGPRLSRAARRTASGELDGTGVGETGPCAWLKPERVLRGESSGSSAREVNGSLKDDCWRMRGTVMG